MRAVLSDLEVLIVRVRSATPSGQLGRREVVADLAQTIRTPASFLRGARSDAVVMRCLEERLQAVRGFFFSEQV